MRRRLAPLWLLLALLGGLPQRALAHVTLHHSDPGAGAILSTTPLKFQFWFTEPVELALTKIVLTDTTGRVIALGEPVQGEDKGYVELQVLNPLGAGTYEVSYQTVALDGHPLKSSYTFRVLGEAEVVDTAFAAAVVRAQQDSAAAALRREIAAKPRDVLEIRTTDPVYVATRTVSFALLLLLLGAPLFQQLVLEPTHHTDAETWRRMSSRIASLSMYVALAFVAIGTVRLFLQTRLVSGNDVPDMSDMSGMLRNTNWGNIWKLQMRAAVAIAVVHFFRRYLRSAAWIFVLLLTGLVAVGTSMASHAGASHTMRAFGVANDTAHILAVGTWLGGLCWLLVACLPAIGSGERRSKRVMTLVNRFSTVALVSVGIVVFTGVVSARFRVGTLEALTSSSYGKALLLKLLAVGVVAAFGYYNWKTIRPSLEGDVTTEALTRSARRELMASLVVIILTALLVALPTPVTG